MDKEEKIRKILKKVSTMSVVYGYMGGLYCPFCSSSVDAMYSNMEDLEHDEDCAYLLAKELLK